jgi:hypothetical protein
MLLVEIGGEKAHDLIVSKGLCPGDQRAIPTDFIMLDSLRVCDNR